MTSSSPRPDPPAERSGSTLIRIEGRDALALLHRISSQSLADLEPGEARPTLFCDFRGRLLHRAVVGLTRDRAVWLLRDDAPAAELVSFLERHVFRDDARVADAPAGWIVRPVPGGHGREAGTLEERDGVPVAVQVDADFGLAVVPGAGREIEPAQEQARILAGRPRHGHEIHSDFTPFEVGLAHEVHLGKGCYTGQETLLRLVAYGGVRRGLARVSGRGDSPMAPRAVLSRGAVVGRLTSAVARDAGWIGLAVLKRDALEPPVALELEGDGALEQVSAFAPTRPLGLPLAPEPG